MEKIVRVRDIPLKETLCENCVVNFRSILEGYTNENTVTGAFMRVGIYLKDFNLKVSDLVSFFNKDCLTCKEKKEIIVKDNFKIFRCLYPYNSHLDFQQRNFFLLLPFLNKEINSFVLKKDFKLNVDVYNSHFSLTQSDTVNSLLKETRKFLSEQGLLLGNRLWKVKSNLLEGGLVNQEIKPSWIINTICESEENEPKEYLVRYNINSCALKDLQAGLQKEKYFK